MSTHQRTGRPGGQRIPGPEGVTSTDFEAIVAPRAVLVRAEGPKGGGLGIVAERLGQVASRMTDRGLPTPEKVIARKLVNTLVGAGTFDQPHVPEPAEWPELHTTDSYEPHRSEEEKKWATGRNIARVFAGATVRDGLVVLDVAAKELPSKGGTNYVVASHAIRFKDVEALGGHRESGGCFGAILEPENIDGRDYFSVWGFGAYGPITLPPSSLRITDRLFNNRQTVNLYNPDADTRDITTPAIEAVLASTEQLGVNDPHHPFTHPAISKALEEALEQS